jgi:hypothetical protein
MLIFSRAIIKTTLSDALSLHKDSMAQSREPPPPVMTLSVCDFFVTIKTQKAACALYQKSFQFVA